MASTYLDGMPSVVQRVDGQTRSGRDDVERVGMGLKPPALSWRIPLQHS